VSRVPIIRSDPAIAALADLYPGPATGRVEHILRKFGSGLADLVLKTIDPYVVSKVIDNTLPGDVERLGGFKVDVLIGRVAFISKVDPSIILGDLQGEQSLVRDHDVHNPAYAYDIILPKPGETLVDDSPTKWLSKGRLFVLREGEAKMVKATGAGIPDGGRNAPWSLEHYLGFDKQVYHAGRLSRAKFDAWRPDLEVPLYRHGVGIDPTTGKPYDHQITVGIQARCDWIPDTVLAGREPLLRVRCADKMAYKRVMYTPSLRAVTERDAVIREILGAL
jgi:hypothetical protein